MKQTRFEQMKQQIVKSIDADLGARVVSCMDEEYEILCRNDHEKCPDLISHLHNNIYPVVATFRALMALGMPKDKASELAQTTFLELMEAPAASIQKLCRIPGLYRIMPWLFGKLMPKLFKKEAGFDFVFHPTEPGHVRFDMKTCPYFQACKELDCLELAPVFCTTDDICYGHMHPNLSWNRTKTIARGGDVCDFDLEVKKSNRK